MDSATILLLTAVAEIVIYLVGGFRAALSRPSRKARLNLS